ncbi:TatD DNase [Glugoides intestinalis]
MFIDIACNITLENMLENIEVLMEECTREDVFPVFVGLDIESSSKCLELARTYNTACYLGMHPNSIPLCNSEISKIEKWLECLDYDDDHVIGIGECGLDYYRSDRREVQKEVFKLHIKIQEVKKLPFFYHCRNSFDDFISIAINNGVVHSFDGTLEEAEFFIAKGFYIGINGCSLKTESNIEVVRRIPLNRILLETDSPYCQVRKSHASAKFTVVDKTPFNKPVNIKKIAEIIAKFKNISLKEVEATVFENTLKVFPKLKNICCKRVEIMKGV